MLHGTVSFRQSRHIVRPQIETQCTKTPRPFCCTCRTHCRCSEHAHVAINAHPVSPSPSSMQQFPNFRVSCQLYPHHFITSCDASLRPQPWPALRVYALASHAAHALVAPVPGRPCIIHVMCRVDIHPTHILYFSLHPARSNIATITRITASNGSRYRVTPTITF